MAIRKSYPFSEGDIAFSKNCVETKHTIVSVKPEQDTVVHKCSKTGTLFETSYLLFPMHFCKERT